jgi:nucleoside 2-deoxyribosyltransferase
MQSPKVFIVGTLDPDWSGVRDAVMGALEENGLVARYSHAIRPGAERAASVLDGIRRADLIIADVSGSNSNVLFELGFAQALQKPTILLYSIKSGPGLPGDLAGFEYTVYDPSDLNNLTDAVKAATKSFLLRRSA